MVVEYLIASVVVFVETTTRLRTIFMPASTGVSSPGATMSTALRLTPISPKTPDTLGAAVVTVRVLPSTTTLTFFGVVTARARPLRPRGCDREAVRTAPSARTPMSSSAVSTVVAVVQYSWVRPSTVTTSLRP